MHNFKEGDRVYYKGDDARFAGLKGTVMEIDKGFEIIRVQFDNGVPVDAWAKSMVRLMPVGGVTTPKRETKIPSSEWGAGLKFDSGKPQSRLLHEGVPRALARVVDTLTFGAKKYTAHSWQQVEQALERYQDASYRHDSKRCLGEKLDPETGIHHRAHHIINELFLLELELRAEEQADGAK